MPPESTLMPFDLSNAYARLSRRLYESWWARKLGPAALERVRGYRLNALVQFARRRSPLYRDAYHGVPEHVLTTEHLPVMAKRELMSRFDDWVTDPSINRRDVETFLADQSNVGQRFRDRYTVWRSSGTTGEPGIYVQDSDAMSVYDALIAVQFAATGLAMDWAQGLLFKGGRAALVAAIGEPFASAASWERTRRSTPGLATRSFSVMEPLGKLVTELNAFAPASLASYPTMLTLLADEVDDGRLRVRPAIVWSGGECLTPPVHAKLERAFRCPVINEYGTSECITIAVGCREDWLHVNSDWVVLEPVDANHRPTPPGETSHTVLLTNLANRVQPIIRYDLGDAVIAKPEPCACGNPLPAIRVEGRSDAIVVMRTKDGRIVKLVPLALTTVLEEAAQIHRFQIVQCGDAHLELRLDVENPKRRRTTFALAARALRGFLANHGIGDARITLDEQRPMPDASSGKFAQVIVERERER